MGSPTRTLGLFDRSWPARSLGEVATLRSMKKKRQKGKKKLFVMGSPDSSAGILRLCS